MRSEDWTYAGRLARQLTGFAFLFLALVGLSVSTGYRWFVANELDEELLEQLDALRGSSIDSGPEAFVQIVEPLGAESAELPLAMIGTPKGESTRWGPAGRRTLFPQDGWGPVGTVTREPNGRRLYRGSLTPKLDVQVVLDGSDWVNRIRTVDTVMLAIVLLGGALSFVAGRWLGRRAGLLLEQVAQQVEYRDSRRDVQQADWSGMPLEVRSITRALEETLRANQAEVKRSKVLTAGLAHDLKAPLQNLLTSTQVALLEQEELGEDSTWVRDHLSELRNLTRIVDNLVVWGAPRIASDEPSGVLFNLADELHAGLKSEEDEAAQAGVFLDILCDPHCHLDGDPSLLMLAIRNLVTNAIAWSPAGGQVTVSVRRAGTRLEILVDDEGSGIPKADRDELFRPFVRGKAAPRQRAGYGLGLSIVAFASQEHGGEVLIEDSPGGGARFVLALPMPESGP